MRRPHVAPTPVRASGVTPRRYAVTVVIALYRRYRPESFAELIGQSQVTDPLRTALRNDRVNHAYLFSGPRGCGKTTSARILARCLNCAMGPTDTPCGTCPSCVELSRDGSGSLDVVEIDAASHNGVDDARDLRERAVFAPARDRFKIFILDEAHMVTPQGFNALLKIVEEPPEHVKFIFATTEPDKVIGTIRSRTHHYPFRLVPPAQMLDYVQQLSESERVSVEPGVLPLVVRAGGGSVRDTLSLLDQLIAGSEETTVRYERAVALLGYTHATLLGEVVDALGAHDAASAFESVDRVIQTGQDPRRFVEDLLERLRDLIVVGAVSGGPTGHGGATDAAAAVLRGIQRDELDRMAQQAAVFGQAELSRAADVVNAALTEMTGATSPRLHLELMIARVLIPASDDSERGSLARIERLERRIGVQSAAAPAPAPAETPAITEASLITEPTVTADALDTTPVPSPAVAPAPSSSAAPVVTARLTVPAAAAAGGAAAPASGVSTTPVDTVEVSAQQLRDAWPEVLEVVEKAKRSAWMVVFTAHVLDLRGDVLYLSFASERDAESFKKPAAGDSVSELLRRAIIDVLGIRVKFVARVVASSTRMSGAPASRTSAPAAAPAAAPASPSAPTARPAAVPPAAEATPEVPESESESAFALRADAPMTTTSWATVAVPTGNVQTGNVPTGEAPTGDAPVPAREKSPVRAAAVTQLEPLDEADREPEPEFEPDDSPLVDVPQPGTPQPATSQTSTSQTSTSQTATSQTSTPQAIIPKPDHDKRRYGESVVREILGASFIEELAVAPRVAPKGD